MLVEAGPGTGKTRTLVGRILELVQNRQVDPASILVLTFSNKAAEEMRERLAQVLPEQARLLTMGTFHAFGLELLRKHGSCIGVPPKPVVLDPMAALFFLESHLPLLPLNHYQNLPEPAYPLRDVLRAISRAKDELVDPTGYQVYAQRMLDLAGEDAKAREAGEKALEVGQIYAIYQSLLDQRGLLDYGDLIAKSVRLLQEHPGLRETLRAQYPHILVDEYQDVNRACARFLQELAGNGAGLWVVGDVRQSVYRFRGATPANMTVFDQDFPRRDEVCPEDQLPVSA